MTDRAPRIGVAAIASALFCVVLIYLALQVRAGNDPAVGADHETAAGPARQVIVRRVILRRIVEEQASPSDFARGARAGTRSAAAPSAAAPAPAAPPMPAAPAAAPVVSGAS